MFLYLLPFTDNKHFKFGVSDDIKEFKRIRTHINNLKAFNTGVDLSNSYIVTSKKKRGIKLLEKELAFLYPALDNNPFSKMDGSTEIREIKDLSYVFDDIKAKANDERYCLNIKRGIELPKKQKRKIIPRKLPTKDERKEFTIEEIEKHIESVTSSNERVLLEFENTVKSDQFYYYLFDRNGFNKLMIFYFDNNSVSSAKEIEKDVKEKFNIYLDTSFHPEITSTLAFLDAISIKGNKKGNHVVKIEFKDTEKVNCLPYSYKEEYEKEYKMRFNEIIKTNLEKLNLNQIKWFDKDLLLPREIVSFINEFGTPYGIVSKYGIELEKEYLHIGRTILSQEDKELLEIKLVDTIDKRAMGKFTVDENNILNYTIINDHESYSYLVGTYGTEHPNLTDNQFVGYDNFNDDIGTKFSFIGDDIIMTIFP